MTDLAHTITGEGRPFLWGHGLLSSCGAEDKSGPIRWPDLDPALDGVGLIRWDARGHGASPRARRPADTEWRSLADDALALASSLGHERFTIGGASMGAATALWAALKAPDRVQQVVLAIPPTAWTKRRRTRRLYGALATLSRLPIVGDENRRTVLEGAVRSDLPAPGELRGIECPVTVLAWRYDPIHPSSIAARLADLLPNATLHVTARPGDTTGWVERIRSALAT